MQRRAAAIYAAVLIVIAAGAYTMMGFAQAPTITLENPEYVVTENDTVTVQDRSYRVADIGDGTGELEWTQSDVAFSDSWENDSTVTLDDTEFRVRTHANESPPRVVLTEVRSVGENVTTTEIGGDPYVVIEEDGDRRIVPEDEYLREQYGPPDVREYTVGDTVTYNNESTMIDGITTGSVTLAWTGPQTNSVRLTEGNVVTLNGQEFVSHFPSGDQVALTADVQAYNQQADRIETYEERTSGLMGVTILSGMFAFLIVVLSYVPSRY